MVKEISTNEEKKPSFFRILVAGYNTEHLPIPRDFLKHILKELSERAVLKLKDSSDSSWSIKVSRTTTGAVRFTDGWQEFLKDNSLGHGNFVVIIYDGRMHFSIQVYDTNACERDVGSTKIGSTHQNSTFADTTKMPSSGGQRKCEGSSSKHPHPSPSSCSDDDSGENLSEPEEEEEEDDEDSTSEDWDDDEDNTSDEDSEDEENNTSEEDIEAASEPESFKSKFPHFKSVIRMSSSVYVPAAFSRKHFSKRKYLKIFMKNAEEKKWAVNVVPFNSSSLSFSAGWSRFASANQIGIGDTCIFELLSSNEMKVRIIRKASV